MHMSEYRTDQPVVKADDEWRELMRRQHDDREELIDGFQKLLRRADHISDVPHFIGFWRVPNGVITYRRLSDGRWDPSTRTEYSDEFIGVLNKLKEKQGSCTT